MRPSHVFVSAMALLAGCSSNPLNVGSSAQNDGGPAGKDETPASCEDGTQLAIVGTWQGRVDDTTFRSGSNALRLDITHANSSQLCGTITFGEGSPPAPPTDPNVGYPPQTSTDTGIEILELILRRNVGHAEGFPFRIVSGRVALPRLRFLMTVNELWKPWCELQRPFPIGSNPEQFRCAPNLPSQQTGSGCSLLLPDGGLEPVDCVKWQLCSMSDPCRCDATGCTAWSPKHWTIEAGVGDGTSVGTVSFDMRAQGDQIDGSYEGYYRDGGHVFHLTKQATEPAQP